MNFVPQDVFVLHMIEVSSDLQAGIGLLAGIGCVLLVIAIAVTVANILDGK